MAKTSVHSDVLVIGDHPCAYFAAAMLRQDNSLKVSHVTAPGEKQIDRLVTVNPDLFELHPLLSPLKRKLEMAPIYGLKFLADDPATQIAHTDKSIGAYITSLKQVHSLMSKLAHDAGVTFSQPKALAIKHLDENGVDVMVDAHPMRAKLLVLAADLPEDQKQILGLPPKWDAEVRHVYTFLRLKGLKWHEPASKPLIPMSLDLGGTMNWAWLLPGPGCVQLAVNQPASSVGALPPATLMDKWIKVLSAHGELKLPAGASIDLDEAVSLELPLAGALAQEGIANRTLLIGPAGGFYTACAEDIYPNCWSAVHAAEVAKSALPERHLQDALQPYRQRWGATLGDYLRGPQQNLRFLLPLVYRNAIMTARLTEAILSGKSVVR